MNKDQNPQTELTILIVDDQPANIDILRQTLEPQGYQILVAPSGEFALQVVHRAKPNLILMDVMMPGIDGFETCRRLKADPETVDIPIIFVTVKGETGELVEGFEVGGVDYITRPAKKEEVLARVETHLKINQLTKMLLETNIELAAANRKLRQEITKREQAEDALQTADEKLSMISEQEAKHWGIAGFVGQSRMMNKIVKDIRLLHQVGTTSVLITGESGTGKELIARAIHYGGPRSKGPFIPVNCSAIPAGLAESTIFGHTKGAFTGANKEKKGYFELSEGGTLFLDEIGDMPLELQAKFLRVLEDGSFTPVGGTRERRANVRILAATNVDFRTKIAAGEFREDLYFRLARFIVTIPPLRERPEDIPLLASHFLGMFATEMGSRKPVLRKETLSALKSYAFPGNVRELKNVIERALIESRGKAICPEHLHFLQIRETPPSADDFQSTHRAIQLLIQEVMSGQLSYNESLECFRRHLVEEALRICDGNRSQAAQRLGMHRPNLVALIKRMAINAPNV